MGITRYGNLNSDLYTVGLLALQQIQPSNFKEINHVLFQHIVASLVASTGLGR